MSIMRVSLIGLPASGKTTLARALVSNLEDQGWESSVSLPKSLLTRKAQVLFGVLSFGIHYRRLIGSSIFLFLETTRSPRFSKRRLKSLLISVARHGYSQVSVSGGIHIEHEGLLQRVLSMATMLTPEGVKSLVSKVLTAYDADSVLIFVGHSAPEEEGLSMLLEMRSGKGYDEHEYNNMRLALDEIKRQADGQGFLVIDFARGDSLDTITRLVIERMRSNLAR